MANIIPEGSPTVTHLPVPVVHEALQLADKVRHGGRHLDLLLGVEQPAQVQRFDLQRAVPSQDGFG